MLRTRGIGGFSHEPHYEGETGHWITPRYIIDAFGVGWFDLDPCASVTQPWSCARKAYTVEQNGLLRQWWGKENSAALARVRVAVPGALIYINRT